MAGAKDQYDVGKWSKDEIQAQITRAKYWSKQNDLSNTIVREMLNHPAINLALNFYTKPIAGAQWQIIADDEAQAEYYEGAIKDQYTALVDMIINALAYGYNAAETMYAIDNGQWILTGLLDSKPDNIQLNNADNGAILATIEGVQLPAWKAFILRYNANQTYPYGRSMLKPAYMHWHFSQLAEYSYARQIERLAAAQTVIKYPPNQTSDASGNQYDANKAIADNIALNMNTDRVLTCGSVPTGEAGWEFTEIGKNNQTSAFDLALRRYDEQILRAMLIPDRLLTNSGDAGSRADQEGKQDMFFLMLESIMELFATAVNKCILTTLGTLQYGKAAKPARLEFLPMTDDRRTLVDTLILEGYKGGKLVIDGQWLKNQREIDDTPQEQLIPELPVISEEENGQE